MRPARCDHAKERHGFRDPPKSCGWREPAFGGFLGPRLCGEPILLIPFAASIKLTVRNRAPYTDGIFGIDL